MTDYQIAEYLAHQWAGQHNMLGIDSVPAGAGALLVVNSGVVAHERPDDELQLEQGVLTRSVRFGSLTAYADLVGLWPDGNQGQGDAALYSVRAPFVPQPMTDAMPFTDAAMQVVEAHKGLTLDTSHHTYAALAHLAVAEGEILLAPPLPYHEVKVLVTPDSKIRTHTVALVRHRKERDLTLDVSGPVYLELGPRHYVRITPDGMYATPDGKQVRVEATVPADQPAALNQTRTVPMGTRLVGHPDGLIAPRGVSPEDDTVARYGGYNPTVNSAEAFPLLDDKPWSNVTDRFLDKYKRELRDNMPAENAALEAQLVAQARATIENKLKGNLMHRLPAGSLAVATMLGELPQQPVPGNQVTASSFA